MSFNLDGKVIAVVGATGAQGGSVARYLLKDGRSKVRAITRNADSASAKALKEAGAEVVVANIDDQASLEKAFAGAHGVFGVTNFGEHYLTTFADISDEIERARACQKKEIEQGQKLVDAVQKAGVKHFVWSTLWHVDDVDSQTPHFESKWQIDEYAKSKKVPLTSLYTAMYFENLVGFGMLRKNDDGSFTVNVATPPKSPLPWYSVTETGGWVVPAFANPDKWIGKDIHALGSFTTNEEFASILAKATGKKVDVLPITDESFFDPNGVQKQIGKEIWLNFKHWHDHGPGPNVLYDVKLSKEVYPEGSDAAGYVANNATIREYLGLN